MNGRRTTLVQALLSAVERRTTLVQALLAAVVLTVLQLIDIFFMIRRLLPEWAELVTGLLFLAATAGILFWISGRVRDIWNNDAGPAGGTGMSNSIATCAAKWVAWGGAGIVLVVVVTIALTVPEWESFPLQPILTFVLSAFWFGYIIVSLNHLVSIDGGSPQQLASFARFSVITAIALSIYFIFPFDWLVDRFIRAYEFVALGHTPDKAFSLSTASPAVLWLESTAIPSAVAIAFGVLVAYVTSVVWYEFYKKISEAGVVNIIASRDGRDPQRDDFWFGHLKNAKARVILCGATLGGWFDNKWEKLRPALVEVVGRESVQQVKIILPEPGGDAFWVRRKDETGPKKSPPRDPVVRLATAIETLYLMLPPESATAEGGGFEQVKSFLEQKSLVYKSEQLRVFHDNFVTIFARPRSANYLRSPENSNSCRTLAAALQGSESEPLPKKFSVVFCRGSILSATVFDDTVFLVPYLPNTEDKDCPQFEISCPSDFVGPAGNETTSARPAVAGPASSFSLGATASSVHR
jgi:hypothetical protein